MIRMKLDATCCSSIELLKDFLKVVSECLRDPLFQCLQHFDRKRVLERDATHNVLVVDSLLRVLIVPSNS